MSFKVITFSLADHIHKRLTQYCKKTGQKQTDVIRQAVFEFLESFHTDMDDSNDEE